MYPQPPQPPTHAGNDEFEEYPLNDTHFVEQRPVMQSPFTNLYPQEVPPRLQPYDSNQPLLPNPSPPPLMPMPYPETNQYPDLPPHISYDINTNGSSPGYYTNAPRRQPRRYKTSKLVHYL